MTHTITTDLVIPATHEHAWEESHEMRRCTICHKVRVNIQAFQQGKPVGEYEAMIFADSERAAVDKFLEHARQDLRFKFLGENGWINNREVANAK